MILEVSHKTVYHYTAPVAQAHHLLHLEPRPHSRQRVIRHTLLVEPAPAARSDFIDYFGNPASSVSIETGHSDLMIHSRGLVEVTAPPPLDLAASKPWNQVAAELAPARKPYDIDVVQYLVPSQQVALTQALIDFARPSFPPARPILECAQHLMHRIYNEFAYDDAATDIATTIEEVLEIRRGVCQDFAHLLIGAMRAFCLPARYVSGYLLTHPPAGGEKLVGADASHAWVSVWAPGIGWVDFDPTNNVLPSDEHVTIAYGRDFQDVSPVTGVLLGGGTHQVEVFVDVVPAHSLADERAG